MQKSIESEQCFPYGIPRLSSMPGSVVVQPSFDPGRDVEVGREDVRGAKAVDRPGEADEGEPRGRHRQAVVLGPVGLQRVRFLGAADEVPDLLARVELHRSRRGRGDELIGAAIRQVAGAGLLADVVVRAARGREVERGVGADRGAPLVHRDDPVVVGHARLQAGDFLFDVDGRRAVAELVVGDRTENPYSEVGPYSKWYFGRVADRVDFRVQDRGGLGQVGGRRARSRPGSRPS